MMRMEIYLYPTICEPLKILIKVEIQKSKNKRMTENRGVVRSLYIKSLLRGQRDQIMTIAFLSLTNPFLTREKKKKKWNKKKKVYVAYEDYQNTVVINTPKEPRKITEKENVVMPLKDTQVDDEVVNHKKGKK